MKNVFWRTSEAKKSGKKQLENNHRVKERNVKTAFFEQENFLFKKKNTEKRRSNGCLADEINDNRMHMDLTRSTTSRQAAIVKRVFDRARNPQRMWISRDYHKMRHGQKHFCDKSNFWGKGCSSRKTDFNQKIRKMIKELHFFSDVKWEKFRKKLGFRKKKNTNRRNIRESQ